MYAQSQLLAAVQRQFIRPQSFAACCRPIRDSKMIDFNPVPIFSLGYSVAKLERAQEGVAVAFVMYDFHETRTILQAFAADAQHTMFPETLAKVGEVLTALDVVLPPSEVPQGERALSAAEAAELWHVLDAVYTTFETESKRKYLVGLHNQRGYESTILIEKMNETVSPECWRYFSEFTKREIRECGRCLAFERYTAAGFHMLRAFESEVRDYVCLVLQAEPLKRDLGYFTDVLARNQASDKLVSSLNEIRRLDRNPLIHPEASLDLDEAVGIVNLSIAALTRLIADMKRQRLLPSIPPVLKSP